MNLQRIRELAGIKLNESVMAVPGLGEQENEAIELGDNSTAEPSWYIVNMRDNSINSQPYASKEEARAGAKTLQWYDPITFDIRHGLDDEGIFVDANTGENEPAAVGGKHPGMVDENQYEPDVESASVTELSAQLSAGEISYTEFKEKLHELENQHYSMQQGEMGNPDMRDDMAYNRPGGDREEWDAFDASEMDDTDDEFPDMDNELEEVILGEEDEPIGLTNGYDVEYANGADYFPNGADAPVTAQVGPSGAKQGDNPEQKKMQVAEVHTELVYGYRKYLKEAAKK